MNKEIRKNEISEEELEQVSGGSGGMAPGVLFVDPGINEQAKERQNKASDNEVRIILAQLPLDGVKKD